MYKPPKLIKKNPPLNRPAKYKPPGGLYLEFALKYKVKQSKNGKIPSNSYKLAQSILKRKFPSIHKPLQKYKGPLKNIRPRAYFGNFTVPL